MNQNYSVLTKLELTVEIKKRGLKVCGNKPDLISRLVEDDLKRKTHSHIDKKVSDLALT